jgi:hypothetical protein
MRRWQEVKEDDPFMASRCEHAQSDHVHSSRRECVMCKCIGDVVFIVFIVSGK